MAENSTTETIPTKAPRKAAVYRLYDADGALLYIGSAYDPEQRCKSHRNKPWWREVAHRTEEWHPSRGHAYQAEMDAIAVEHSKYNRMGTPGYTTPDTEGIRRRNELSRARARAESRKWEIWREVLKDAKAAGMPLPEAYRRAEKAAFEYIESTGLFTAFIARQRAVLTQQFAEPPAAE